MNISASQPLLTQPDVLIVGGGIAGLGAALGAAEEGAKVTLLEKNGFLGGKATAAYVGTVCGLYYRSESTRPRLVMGGPIKAFAEQLQAQSRTRPISYRNGLHFLPYDRFAFLFICDKWALQHADSIGLHAYVHGLSVEERQITAVNALVYHQPVVFMPRTVVDTSGEAVIARLSGISMLKSDEYQASALVFSLLGLAAVDQNTISLALIRLVQKGIASEDLPPDCGRLSVVPGSVKNGKALFKLGIPLSVNDKLNQMTYIELYARQLVRQAIVYLQMQSEIFRDAQLEILAPEVGIRTGPRHEGRYLLTESDVLACRKNSDTITRGAWPIEKWAPGDNPVMTYFALDDYYDIPADALQSAQLDNLFFAGRNISADEEAVASARVIGTSLATGYAAGRLAAAQALGKSRGQTIAAIQRALEITYTPPS